MFKANSQCILICYNLGYIESYLYVNILIYDKLGYISINYPAHKTQHVPSNALSYF